MAGGSRVDAAYGLRVGPPKKVFAVLLAIRRISVNAVASAIDNDQWHSCSSMRTGPCDFSRNWASLAKETIDLGETYRTRVSTKLTIYMSAAYGHFAGNL